MSRLIEMKFSVDSENPQEVQNLINVLSGFLPIGEVPVKSIPKVEPDPEEKPVKSIPKVEPDPEEKPVPKKKTPAKAEKPKEEKTTEESNLKTEDVRSLLAKKVGSNRTEIKAKLTELGAPNVSQLDKSKYQEFHDFLSSL